MQRCCVVAKTAWTRTAIDAIVPTSSHSPSKPKKYEESVKKADRRCPETVPFRDIVEALGSRIDTLCDMQLGKAKVARNGDAVSARRLETPT